MGSTGNRSIRAPLAVWDDVYAEAERRGVSPNRVAVERLSPSVERAPGAELPGWLRRLSRYTR